MSRTLNQCLNRMGSSESPSRTSSESDANQEQGDSPAEPKKSPSLVPYGPEDLLRAMESSLEPEVVRVTSLEALLGRAKA